MTSIQENEVLSGNFNLTDEEYEAEIKRITTMAHDLTALFGLKMWKIGLQFHRSGHNEEYKLNTFTVEIQAEYLTADISVNMPFTVKVSDIGIRRRLAHEFAHMILEIPNTESKAEWLARLILWLEECFTSQLTQVSGKKQSEFVLKPYATGVPMAPFDQYELGNDSLVMVT